MGKEVNMLGKRFGRLVAIERTGVNKFGKRVWRFLCDCGKETVVAGETVRHGNSKSCGCYRNEFKKLPGDGGSFSQMYMAYRDGSVSRKIPFLLTKDEFRKLTSKFCRYCGSDPKPYLARNRKVIDVVPYIGNGVDRVDNSKGYSVSNCVPCCSLCNYMKRGLTVSEFISHVHKISSFPSEIVNV